jgi:retron-type reverse transcriptase
LRPIGVAALEDKIVQRAVVDVLNGIYEADFLGFSYGLRPGRSAHDARWSQQDTADPVRALRRP